MVYFIRARTHFQYAESLFKELMSGQRVLSIKALQEVFLQGLKALHALTILSPPEKPLSSEELFKRILPTLSESEREYLLRLKNLLFSAKDYNKDDLLVLLTELKGYITFLKECLKPIL